MCTNIVEKTQVTGWGRNTAGWFDVREVSVSFDHPFRAPLEHAITVDFMSGRNDLSHRLAVELSPESAREMIRVLEAALARGEAENVRVHP